MEGILFLLFFVVVQAIVTGRKAKKEAAERQRKARENTTPGSKPALPTPPQRPAVPQRPKPLAPPVANDPLRDFLDSLGIPQESPEPPPTPVSVPTDPPKARVLPPPPPTPVFAEAATKMDAERALRKVGGHREQAVHRSNATHRTNYDHRTKSKGAESDPRKMRQGSVPPPRESAGVLAAQAAANSATAHGGNSVRRHPLLDAQGVRAGILWSVVLDRPRYRTPALSQQRL